MSKKVYLFRKSSGEWVFGDTVNSIIPAGLVRLDKASAAQISIRWVHNRDIEYLFEDLTFANFFKENDQPYASLTEFLSSTAGFFARLDPYFSETMVAGRLNSKGEITDLTSAFKLAGGLPFSICVVPKAATTDTLLIVELKLYHDDAASDFPCPISDWTPGNILEIPAEAIDLLSYNVYWGCGQKAERDV
jgi:hypothetical protein